MQCACCGPCQVFGHVSAVQLGVHRVGALTLPSVKVAPQPVELPAGTAQGRWRPAAIAVASSSWAGAAGALPKRSRQA